MNILGILDKLKTKTPTNEPNLFKLATSDLSKNRGQKKTNATSIRRGGRNKKDDMPERFLD